MIEIEVIVSPDQEIIGNHSFYKNIISVGKKVGDILVKDDVFDGHLSLKVEKNNCLCTCHKDAPFFHVNDKRISGTSSVKLNDRIKIANTLFQVKKILFQEEEEDKREMLFKKNLKEISNNYPEIQTILDNCEKDLKEIINIIKK